MDKGFLFFDRYQKRSRKFAVYPNVGKNFIYPVLGLAGEAGEVAEKIKKIIRDDGGKISEKKSVEIAKELGDVLWYVANIATELNIKLSSIAEMNLVKLQLRADSGQLKGSGDNR